MIGQVIQAQKLTEMLKKRPPKSSKNEMLVLDYVQLLMIGWVIWVMKVDWAVKKGPLSH